MLSNRLRDVYITELYANMEACTSLILYRQIQPCFKRANYLNIIDIPKYRNALAKLRLNSHKLNIETGRHRQIERNLRICTLCNMNDIEDEFHFFLVCPFYTHFRNIYIEKYYRNRPSMYKFIALLKSDKRNVLNKLAVYCIKAFELRKEHFNT